MPFLSGIKNRRKSDEKVRKTQPSPQEHQSSQSTSSRVPTRSDFQPSSVQASNDTTPHDTSVDTLSSSLSGRAACSSSREIPSDMSQEENHLNATPFTRESSGAFSSMRGAPSILGSSVRSSHSLASSIMEADTPPMSAGSSPPGSPSIPPTPPLQQMKLGRPRLVGPAPSEGFEEVPRPQLSRFGMVLPATFEFHLPNRVTMPCLAYGTAQSALSSEDFGQPPSYESVAHRPHDMVFSHTHKSSRSTSAHPTSAD